MFDGSRAGSGGGGGEKYEKAVAKHGDRTFYKFKHRMSRYPQQIIRQVERFRSCG